jgi:hypothetical protein
MGSDGSAGAGVAAAATITRVPRTSVTTTVVPEGEGRPIGALGSPALGAQLHEPGPVGPLDVFDHDRLLADLAARADAGHVVGLIEAVGERAHGGEQATRDGDERDPLGAHVDADEPEQGGHGGADGEGGEEEGAGHGDLAGGERHRQHQPDPPPGLRIAQVHPCTTFVSRRRSVPA